jgi:hypothetical protein
MQIIPFRRRLKQSRIANCIDCGSHFERAASRHTRCRQCFMWRRGCKFVQLAAHCFQAVRQ